MTKLDQLISAYGQACLASASAAEAHGRTKKQRHALSQRRRETLDIVVNTRKQLVDEINETFRKVRLQHHAALLLYGQHVHTCACMNARAPCSCGFDLCLAVDVVPGPGEPAHPQESP